MLLPDIWSGSALSLAPELQRLKREIVMPRYLFHLSDAEDTFLDDVGKELEDSLAAHAHALRIVEKARRFIPDSAKGTWKIRVTLATGQSVMTVISPGVDELPQEPFRSEEHTSE